MKTEHTMKQEAQDFNWGSKTEITLVIILCIVAGFIAKIPHFFPISEDFFYMRNIGFIALPGLSAYFAWKNKISITKMIGIGSIIVLTIIYINTLNIENTSDTLVLACIHMVLFSGSLVAYTFVNDLKNDTEKRLTFLKYIGDVLVMSAMMMIAGGIVSGITIGLFTIIGMQIENYYFQNIAIWGVAAVPMISTYLVQNNPNLVGKVAPIIAKIFSPVVLLMLVVYLIAIISTGQDPYNDREFLMMFNVLLIGVMALLIFGIAGNTNNSISKFQSWVSFLLSAITLVICGIALSAILFRISEWGITPNRLAVLGSNVLIFTHLLLVALQLLKYNTNKNDLTMVEKSISIYLPVYFLWSVVVCFLFPLLF